MSSDGISGATRTGKCSVRQAAFRQAYEVHDQEDSAYFSDSILIWAVSHSDPCRPTPFSSESAPYRRRFDETLEMLDNWMTSIMVFTISIHRGNGFPTVDSRKFSTLVRRKAPSISSHLCESCLRFYKSKNRSPSKVSCHSLAYHNDTSSNSGALEQDPRSLFFFCVRGVSLDLGVH
jgi:hypothetical protein